MKVTSRDALENSRPENIFKKKSRGDFDPMPDEPRSEKPDARGIPRISGKAGNPCEHTDEMPRSQIPPKPAPVSAKRQVDGERRFEPGLAARVNGEAARGELSEFIAGRLSSATGPISRAELAGSGTQAAPPVPGEAAGLSAFNESLQDYLEICDMTMRPWKPQDLVDAIHLLVKSLGLDAVSLVMVDPEREGRLLPVVSRGYGLAPGPEIAGIWETCLNGSGRSVDWALLMERTSSPGEALATWARGEGFARLGYSPVSDGRAIHGFLMVGAYGGGSVSPLAKSFLEMLGGRLGLSAGFFRDRGDWPKSVVKAARSLRDCVSVQAGVLDMLRESGRLSPEELGALLDSGARALSEANGVLDRLFEEASGSPQED